MYGRRCALRRADADHPADRALSRKGLGDGRLLLRCVVEAAHPAAAPAANDFGQNPVVAATQRQRRCAMMCCQIPLLYIGKAGIAFFAQGTSLSVGVCCAALFLSRFFMIEGITLMAYAKISKANREEKRGREKMSKRKTLLGAAACLVAAIVCIGLLIGNLPKAPVAVKSVAAQMRVLEHVIAASGTAEPEWVRLVQSEVDGVIAQIAIEEGQPIEPDNLLLRFDEANVTLQLAKARMVLDVHRETAQALRQARENSSDGVSAVMAQIVSAYATVGQEASVLPTGDSALDEKREQLLLMQVKELERMLEKQHVYSVVAGTVISCYVEEGAVVAAGTPLVAIAAPGALVVHATVDAEAAGKIVQGQRATVHASDVAYSAHVSNIRTLISGTGSGRQTWGEVTLTVDEPERLSSGAKVEVEIYQHREKPALCIPLDAVLGAEDSYVLVVSNNTARKRYVQLGARNDIYVEVLAGLSEGERVVLDPVSALDREAAIIPYDSND